MYTDHNFIGALHGLFSEYSRDPASFPWSRVEDLRYRVRDNPARLDALDALAGVVEMSLGREQDAAILFSKVSLSPDSSNSDQMIAHAGMACQFVDVPLVGTLVKKIEELAVGYEPTLWLVEALKRLLEALEGQTAAPPGCAEGVYRIAVEACEKLEHDRFEKTRDEVGALRVDIELSYGVILADSSC